MKFGWLPEMAYLIIEFGVLADPGFGRDVEVSVVGGPTEDTLWIMAREPVISAELHQRLVATAAEHYDVDALEFVSQERNQLD